MSFIELFKNSIDTVFLTDDRYLIFINGLISTLIIAFFAAILGILIGIVFSIIKVYSSFNKKFRFLGWLVNIYINVIRGTPVVLQLLISYFIIFKNSDNAYIVAMITFGVNSGAYVAEIFRAGIQSIEKGQTEAGRSLGFSSNQTMIYIILPQAIKNVLPALCNEFITLLKETSVASYISVVDLTKAGEIVVSQTFNPYLPLLFVAAMYLILVLGLTYLVRIFERRLSKHDKN